MSAGRFAPALLALLAGLPIAVGADDGGTVLTSSERQTPLLELYTSEGCSSCPPADRWLSSLAGDAGLWADFVPVEFHVDYWDYIGWKDRFATPAWSARQRELTAEGGARTVYTPGVFLDGKAWLGWRGGAAVPHSAGRTGTLTLHIDGQHIGARFVTADQGISEPVLHVALLGMGLESHVKSGENRGRRLHHDFVVLGLSSARLLGEADVFTAVARLPAASESAERYALAAWVSANGNVAPVQAAGGYLSSVP